MALPVYASTGQRVWHYSFRVICGLIFFFLIAPILVIIPLSFNAQDFFTFTPKMLALDPDGYSTKHYRDFFTNSDWQLALSNSLKIAPVATLLSVSLGTLAAIGLSQSHVPFRRAIMATLISPMIVPLIISATGMYFFYSNPYIPIPFFGKIELPFTLTGTYLGVVLAHSALGIPFVIITVTATLVGFDQSLTRASANMGAGPVRTFFKIQMPLILPGVVSGALFRVHHIVRRGCRRPVRRIGGSKNPAMANVYRFARADQPDDPGGSNSADRGVRFAADRSRGAAAPVGTAARHFPWLRASTCLRSSLYTRREAGPQAAAMFFDIIKRGHKSLLKLTFCKLLRKARI